jgi:hypothetical protein
MKVVWMKEVAAKVMTLKVVKVMRVKVGESD